MTVQKIQTSKMLHLYITQKLKVLKICGKSEVKSFLETLGFVNGSDISIVSKNSGNFIVAVKDTRVAISKEMANKIMVEESI